MSREFSQDLWGCRDVELPGYRDLVVQPALGRPGAVQRPRER